MVSGVGGKDFLQGASTLLQSYTFGTPLDLLTRLFSREVVL